MKLSEVKEGDTLIADNGFTCIDAGPVTIRRDPREPEGNDLYFQCRTGQHFLSGQVCEHGYLIGLTKP